MKSFWAVVSLAVIFSGRITSTANSMPIGPDSLLRPETGLSQRSSYDPTGGNQDSANLTSSSSKPVESLAADLPKLRVRTAGPNALRLIEDVNGKPFFMAGWAPQNIVHTIPTSAMNDYFKTRHAQGFNTAWVVVSGWIDAQGEDNPIDQRDYAGNYMVLDRSNPSLTPSNLNEAYIASVDAMVKAAQQNGIYLFLNVMNVGGSDKVWPKKGQAECKAWGKFWGDRYAQYPHVNFMLGNDWMPQPQGNWIVEGVKESMPDRLFTVDEGFYNHSGGNANRPNPWWQYKDAGATWVNLWGWYSYEASPASPEHTVYQYSTWLMYTQAAKWGVRIAPTFLIETEYSIPGSNGEGTGIPTEFNTPDAHVLRRQLWSVPLGGGTGWGIIGNYDDWLHDSRTTLNDPVFRYFAGYCKSFFTARRWDLLVPDYRHAFLTSQMGQPGIHDPTYMSAALATDGSWGAVYYPGVPGNVDKLTLNLSKLHHGRGASRAYWFDPTSGTTKSIPGSPFRNSGSQTFTTPGINAAGNKDWVLIAESSDHR